MCNKSNMLAGKLFKAAGTLAMLGAAFPDHAILFILVPVILAGSIQSYIHIRSTKERKEL